MDAVIWGPDANEDKIKKVISERQKEYLKILSESENHEDYRPVLLLASYCDDPECSESLPCEECLKMCNIAFIPVKAILQANVLCGYNFLK